MSTPGSGVTEELTSRLAGLRHVAVSSSTTVAEYDRRGKSLPRIGADLGVDYIIEGSVRWARAADAPRVRITPKLIRVSDGVHVWVRPYADLSDGRRIGQEISANVAGVLKLGDK